MAQRRLGARQRARLSLRPEEPRLRYPSLRRELIGVERGALVDLRNRGRLKPELLRVIERDLDLEEARLGSG